MSMLRRVAFIGNHLPRRCGIATFTHDLHRAVAMAAPGIDTCVVAMNDPSGVYDYPPPVRFQVRDDTLHDYRKSSSRPERCRCRCRFAAARVRHLRRRGRRQHPRVGVPAENADRDDAAHRAGSTITCTACRAGPDHRYFGQARRHVGQGPALPPIRAWRSGREDRGHTARHPRISVHRAGERQGEIRLFRQGRHSHVWAVVPEQRHRDRHRCHAGDHQSPVPTPCMWFSAPRIPISCATRAKPIAKA